VPIEPGARLPVHEQIYRAIRDQVVAGHLSPNARLPSTRALSADLGVSRFTVVTAIDRLLAEGYLAARRGAGTFVAAVLPERSIHARPARKGSLRVADAGVAPAISARGAALGTTIITGPRDADGPRPFHPRRPALDVFPMRLWARLIARQWRSARPHDLDYGDPAGYQPLREAIAHHISTSRAVRCGPRNVIVTSGAQQAFDVLFRTLLDPGDEAWMEEPGYLDVRAALIAAGAAIVPVPVDSHGLDVAAGVARAPRARLAVVSPSHQYPTGVTLAAPRRAELLEWARRAGAWIVEDDYDSYFRYRGRPVPALQYLDGGPGESPAARVTYVGTFSKTMFPSLRLGFCVVPDALVDTVANARAVAGRNSPIVEQAALATFIADGHYDRHLRRSRLVYQERYEAMQAAAERELGGLLTLAPAAAGTHVIAWFAGRGGRLDGARAARVAREAAQDGLVVFPLSRYCIDRPARDGLVLGYGAATPRQIAAGAARLARVLRRC
jgi:GntR family transcriptional regulator/MocR family aminotransferase